MVVFKNGHFCSENELWAAAKVALGPHKLSVVSLSVSAFQIFKFIYPSNILRFGFVARDGLTRWRLDIVVPDGSSWWGVTGALVVGRVWEWIGLHHGIHLIGIMNVCM